MVEGSLEGDSEGTTRIFTRPDVKDHVRGVIGWNGQYILLQESQAGVVFCVLLEEKRT